MFSVPGLEKSSVVSLNDAPNFQRTPVDFVVNEKNKELTVVHVEGGSCDRDQPYSMETK